MPKKEDKPAAALVQINEALEAVELEAAELLDEGQELPDSLLLRIHAFIQAKAENVDEAISWMRFIEARIAFLKQQEDNLATMRRRAEAMYGRVKDSLRQFLDGGEKDPISPGRAAGKIFKMWTQRAGQPKLLIDEEVLPSTYRNRQVTITIPDNDEGVSVLNVLQKFVETYDGDLGFKIGAARADTDLIRAKLKRKEEVLGARLEYSRYLRDNSPKNAVVKTR